MKYNTMKAWVITEYVTWWEGERNQVEEAADYRCS